MIPEPIRRIDPSKDVVIKHGCGCQVTFSGKSRHRSSKLAPCEEHSGRELREIRNRIVYASQRKLRQIQGRLTW